MTAAFDLSELGRFPDFTVDIFRSGRASSIDPEPLGSTEQTAVSGQLF